MNDCQTGERSGDPEALLNLARRGDADALARLLEMYRSYLRLCSRVQVDRYLRGKADVSDLIQETLFIARRSFHEFCGDSEHELVAWLRQILVSRLTHLIHRYETQRRDAGLEISLDQALNHSSFVARSLTARRSTAGSRAVRREEAVLLADAIAELSEEHREVLILHHFQYLPFPEVAERMACSEQAVKKLWVRALAALKVRFEEQLP
jgi:RNA polymerase sigma-70 factor, ECF subfamily